MTRLNLERLKSLVVLNRLHGGGFRIVSLLKEGVGPSEILERIRIENFAGKAESLKKIEAVFDPAQEIEECHEKGISLLSLLDADYPMLLRQIPDPPLLLYYRGCFLECDQAAVAVVGSRHPSFYGLTQAKKFAHELACHGLTIVSGFAQGIDQAAHEAALQVSHGRTLAVLGCGLNVVYPKGSEKLADKIAERGVILSEFALGTNPLSENFPRRNRIISGLSLGVLVVEAHSRSGSLITAHEAADQGRDVFAIPGPVDQLTSQGTHLLIQEGASLVQTPSDIMEQLAPAIKRAIQKCDPDHGLSGLDRSTVIEDGLIVIETSEPAVPAADKITKSIEAVTAPRGLSVEDLEDESKDDTGVSETEQRVMGSLEKGPLVFDEIVVRCSLHPNDAAFILTKLELQKKIQKTPAGQFVFRKNEP
ncbi:MAG: DNA-processing protein DprA [Candidatus Omnitrophica bacterium]|nr:DNA-processing protein DprA [Candidatus Omnitrophota bacterium]